jgi:hypothetical protein
MSNFIQICSALLQWFHSANGERERGGGRESGEMAVWMDEANLIGAPKNCDRNKLCYVLKIEKQ